MAEETIFSKIIRRDIPSDIVYQDDSGNGVSRYFAASANADLDYFDISSFRL